MNTTKQDLFAAFNARHASKDTIPYFSYLKPRVATAMQNTEVQALKRDQVLCGESSERYKFLAINTLDGAVIIFNNGMGDICYYADPTFVQLASIRQAGFMHTYGVIQGIEMFNHLMAIPDSYV